VHISELSLTNFRIYRHLEVNLPLGHLILVGSNAQGKTSLLEAVHYLAGANSPHKGSHRQLLHWLAMQEDLQPHLRICAEVVLKNETRKVDIRLQIDNNGKDREPRLTKHVLVDGLKMNASALSGIVNVVMFLPQNMVLVEGSPRDRRNYLDTTISQVDSVYANAVRDYAKILTQRNALLKKLQERQDTMLEELEFWDEQLCEKGSVVVARRARALSEIQDYATNIHSELTNDSEYLQLKYYPSFDLNQSQSNQLTLGLDESFAGTTVSADEMVEVMKDNIVKLRKDEKRRGMTLVGPHRDDFRFEVSGIDLSLFGSRGQGRTAVLALKLAEMEWMRDRSGEWPILLLDEVLAELDLQRRKDLLQRVHAAEQVMMTTTDLDMIPEQSQARACIWNVARGTLSPAS
jgi:DNA replication and repair protein RecF